jgi:hypothetical protein
MLLFIGIELHLVTIARAVEAGLQITDVSGASDFLLFVIAELRGIALAHTSHAALKIAGAEGTPDFIELLEIQLSLVAILKTVEAVEQIAVLLRSLHGLALGATEGRLIAGRKTVQAILKDLGMWGLHGLRNGAQKRNEGQQDGQGNEAAKNNHDQPPNVRCAGGGGKSAS